MGIVLASLSKSGKGIELVVIAIVILLVVMTFVIYTRRGAKARGRTGGAETNAASYYHDVGGLPGTPGGTMLAANGPSPQADPFAAFGALSGQSVPQATVAPMPTAPVQMMTPTVPMPAPMPAPAAPMGPLPGTPAGWLPDPSGDPDTLRYWDGAGWTEHLARRT